MKRVQKAADERNVIKWTRHHGRRGTPLSVYRVRGPSPRTQLQGTQGCNLVPQPNVVLLLLHSPSWQVVFKCMSSYHQQLILSFIITRTISISHMNYDQMIICKAVGWRGGTRTRLPRLCWVQRYTWTRPHVTSL